MDRLKYQKGEEPLLYAGGSYGTDVGQMFASMQPHRVKRMFLDGVDNTLDEISGAFISGLWDADKIMDNMSEYCALAGPDRCDLYAGPTGDDTRKRVLDIIGDMEQNGPVSVPRFGGYDASVITLSDIFESAYYMFYYPLFDFRWWAKAVAPLSWRDGRAYVEIYKVRCTFDDRPRASDSASGPARHLLTKPIYCPSRPAHTRSSGAQLTRIRVYR